jgi:HPt (histidine-containing phosphotransfer) domain-containing protein
VIDLTALNERAEGDKEYLKDIMGSYINEMPVYVIEMNDFVKNGNFKAVSAQAHKMKSPAKLLGAFELNQQLEFIEKQVPANGLSDQMKKKVDQMNSLCIETVDALKKELEKIS